MSDTAIARQLRCTQGSLHNYVAVSVGWSRKPMRRLHGAVRESLSGCVFARWYGCGRNLLVGRLAGESAVSWRDPASTDQTPIPDETSEENDL